MKYFPVLFLLIQYSIWTQVVFVRYGDYRLSFTHLNAPLHKGCSSKEGTVRGFSESKLKVVAAGNLTKKRGYHYQP